MKAYEKEIINELVEDLLDEGYTVYLAERGTYGFYTDESEERVVSFQVNTLSINFSGNYTTNAGRKIGNGWRLDRDTYHRMLQAYPPYWVTQRLGDDEWLRYTTVQENLDMYDASSRYTRLEGNHNE